MSNGTEFNNKYGPRPGHIPGVAINLGGIDFVLAPLSIGLAREIEAKAKELQDRAPAAPMEDWYDFNVAMILASLQRNYPDMTRELLEPLLDTVNTAEAANLTLAQGGTKRVTPAELTPRGSDG